MPITSATQRDDNADSTPNLLQVRMLNEFTYCPRLFHIEWVQGEFADNYETVDGRYKHRRIDRKDGAVPDPSELGPGGTVYRSVLLSDADEGLIARIDLLETDHREVIPVEYKRGSAPDIPERVWEPERIQLCAQGLILQRNGYTCARGSVYFTDSKERVEVPFDETLINRTRELRDEALRVAALPTPPAPLEDSPKCPRCSLVGICLPDEINTLFDGEQPHEKETRKIIASRTDALPLYVQKQGAKLSRSAGTLRILEKGKMVESARFLDISQVSVFGNVQVSTQTVAELARRSIPLCYFSTGGWFRSITSGLGHKNIHVRQQQFRAADDAELSLSLARRFIVAKIKNCRTLLRRNLPELKGGVLKDFTAAARRASRAKVPQSLLGFEGTAARLYFGKFSGLLKSQGDEHRRFEFGNRNRRPPRDPVNAMLSLAYAMLTKDAHIALLAVGLDPMLGFFHKPRFGRPALALDMMEEFRPLIADSCVLTAVNTGIISQEDFIRGGPAVSLTSGGRAKFIKAYERRMDQLVTHPVFGYRITYRRVLEVQARLLARFLMGEIESYPMFLTR